MKARIVAWAVLLSAIYATYLGTKGVRLNPFAGPVAVSPVSTHLPPLPDGCAKKGCPL